VSKMRNATRYRRKQQTSQIRYTVFKSQPKHCSASSLGARPWRADQVRISFTVRKRGLTGNQLWGIVVPLIANTQPRYEGWWQLYRHLCKSGQTRVFAASIMMFRERVRRTSFYNWRVDMGTTRKPRKESDKATLARIKKEMAQPRIAKSARKWASVRQDSQ
jgi:hypothetical protein